MTGARNGVQYCLVPLYALIANPAAYHGRKIATFGYFIGEGEGDNAGALGPDADAMRRYEFISCVAAIPKTVEDDAAVSSVRSGMYFAMVDGTFQKGAVNGVCVGSVANAHLSRLTKVNEDVGD